MNDGPAINPAADWGGNPSAAPGSADEHWWRAVLDRDAAYDGRFVYGVVTTHVYCRPTCSAKRPRRINVVFFPEPGAAERCGFRPCRRCRPRESQNRETQLVANLCKRIGQCLDDDQPLTLEALSAASGRSKFQVRRVFQKVMGISPREFAEAERMRRLKSSLKQGGSVTTALYDAGFSSSSRLYERAGQHLGMTPATYRRGGAGMKISYTVTSCPLGRLLVAATERGISAVYLGNDAERLRAALGREYPRAEITPGEIGLSRWVHSIIEHLRGHEPQLDLPLDVQATAFQKRVWEELRRIPYGATRTYAEVAKAIGQPSAVRAVASACARNPVSVVVPCHRVVRSDGHLGGYRWGLERKHELLRQEAGRKYGEKPKG